MTLTELRNMISNNQITTINQLANKVLSQVNRTNEIKAKLFREIVIENNEIIIANPGITVKDSLLKMV